jgi:predicted dehydrogenase
VEVTCWADTQVHPIEAEDHAVGLVRYENGAIGQFEVSWTFRGGMDLRDEVAGTDGTVWLNHWMRTGFEMFTGVGQGGYVAEKAEGDTGWLFPVGDEVNALGYTDMFADMLDSMENGKAPYESFYDGYIVNSIIDACYKSAETRKWEPVIIDDWRGSEEEGSGVELVDYDADHFLIKKEKMPDGRTKVMLKEKATGKIVQKVV